MSDSQSYLSSSGAKVSSTGYHLQCSGRALETVNLHSTPIQDGQDLTGDGITIYGAAFCPFVQRWDRPPNQRLAPCFQVDGIPYVQCSTYDTPRIGFADPTPPIPFIISVWTNDTLKGLDSTGTTKRWAFSASRPAPVCLPLSRPNLSSNLPQHLTNT